MGDSTTQEATLIDTVNELPPEAGVNPKPKKTGFDTKVKARNSAVAAINPEARDGFEFETFKLDGRWHWRVFDVPRPDTAAQAKANGRKADQARHEQRGAERAAGEGRLRTELPPQPLSSLVQMAQAIEGTKVAGEPGPALLVEVLNKPFDDLRAAKAKPTVKAVIEEKLGALLTKPDTTEGPDGIPKFLKRESTPEEKEAVRKKLAKTVGPERKIKDPPNVADAVRRAERQEAKLAKVEGTPAHAKAVRAAKKAAAAKDTAPAKKRTTGAQKAVATASTGPGVGAIARDAILRGKSNEEALAAVMKAHPGCSSNLGCMNWYRNKLKKDGLLLKDGTVSAKGKAALDPKKAG